MVTFQLQLLISYSPDGIEKIELKSFFSDVCGTHKLKSSSLWQTLAGAKSRKRILHTVVFASQLSRYHCIKGTVVAVTISQLVRVGLFCLWVRVK